MGEIQDDLEDAWNRKVFRDYDPERYKPRPVEDRALAILHRMATECSNDGWWHRLFCRRWYYSDEPLRNDAANLVREAGFGMPMPLGTRLVGDPD
jgi:hypothetical protein